MVSGDNLLVKKTMTAKTKTETMLALVDQWKSSETTQKQFCSEHNLKCGESIHMIARNDNYDQGDIQLVSVFDLIILSQDNVIKQVNFIKS